MARTDLPRVFLSYSTADKFLAGAVKDRLEVMEFDVFLAHSTLVASEEWRKEIKGQLEKRDVFIVLLTPKVKKSDWVDQEVGMAIALGKTIIPLQAPTKVYGFAADFHAIPLDTKDPWNSMKDVVRAVVTKHPTAGDSFRKGTIRRLCESNSFNEARISLQILDALTPKLTRGERKRIYRASLTNGQIGGYREVKDFVDGLEREFKRK